jgi:hypothetical protein
MSLDEVTLGDWAKEHRNYLATRQRAIVSRFENSLRYVSVDQANAKTFSYEFASILRDAGSAFGSFSDAVVRGSDPTKSWKRAPDIKDFFNFYIEHIPNLPEEDINIGGHSGSCKLQPFWGWTAKEPPVWWTAYNKVKHSEYKHAKLGNLQNATNAVAAVEIILRYATLSQEGRGTGLFSLWGRTSKAACFENEPF